MKKIISLFLVLLSLIFCFSSCTAIAVVLLYDEFVETHFEFLHDTSEITTIEIVKITEIEQTGSDSSNPPTMLTHPYFEKICTVEDKEQFISDFIDIKCKESPFTGAPHSGDIGIKITYASGDYDVICLEEQIEYHGGSYYIDRENVLFDEAAFNELISKYTANASALQQN